MKTGKSAIWPKSGPNLNSCSIKSTTAGLLYNDFGGKGGKKGGSVQHKASFFFFFYILCLSEQLVWTLVASAGKNFPLFFPKFYFDGHAFTTLLLRSACVSGCPFFQFPNRVVPSDEPELEFSSSSQAMKVPSQAGTLQFSSWNRADNISKNSQFLTYLSQVFQELQLFWIIEYNVTKRLSCSVGP